MPQLIVPGIARFSAYGTLIDRPWVNIFDVAMGDSPAVHSTMIAVANAIADTYYNNLRASMASTWNFQGVKYMDLSTPSGEVGGITDTPAAYTMPFVGSGVGVAATGNNAALVTKTTFGGRSQRRGRTFLGGHLQSNITGQTLTTTAQTAMQTWATNLLAAIAAAGTATAMVVVHNPSGGQPGATSVTGYSVSLRLATQRRRLRA